MQHPLVDADEARQVRVATAVVKRHQVGAERVAVGGVEEASDVVAGEAPLTVPGRPLGDDILAVETEAESVLRQVDPVVEAVDQPVAGVLRTGQPGESVEDVAHLVDPPVAVVVAVPVELRRLDEEEAAVRGRDRARQDQPIEQGHAPVHDAVAVIVLEADHATDRGELIATVDVRHEAPHLDHQRAAVGVERDRDRVFDQRLGRDELDAEAVDHGDRSEPLLRRQDRRGWDLDRRGQVGLLLPLLVALLGGDGGGEGQDEGDGVTEHHRERG